MCTVVTAESLAVLIHTDQDNLEPPLVDFLFPSSLLGLGKGI